MAGCGGGHDGKAATSPRFGFTETTLAEASID